MLKIKEQFKENEIKSDNGDDILKFINNVILLRVKENMSAATFIFSIQAPSGNNTLSFVYDNLINNYVDNVFIDIENGILSIKW